MDEKTVKYESLFMNCPFCLKLLQRIDGTDFFDCYPHYYSTIRNNIIQSYEAYWKINQDSLKITSSKTQNYTSILLMESMGIYKGKELFSSNCYFDCIENEQPNPQKIITKLLNLKSFI